MTTPLTHKSDDYVGSPRLPARAGRTVLRRVNQGRRALGLAPLRALPDWEPVEFELDGERSCPLARAFGELAGPEEFIAVDSASDDYGWGPNAWKMELPSPYAEALARAWGTEAVCRICMEWRSRPDPHAPFPFPPGETEGLPHQIDIVRLPTDLAQYGERFDVRLERYWERREDVALGLKPQ